MSLKALLVLLAFGGSVALAAASTPQFPSYLTKCKFRDPELNKCILKNGREALPDVIRGDKQLKVPILDPFTIPKVKVENGRPPIGLTVTMKDVVLTGLKLTEFKDTDADFENGIVKSEFWLPRLQVISKYEMDGKILVLPISGKGDANITMVNTKLDNVLKFHMITKDDGLQYVNITTLGVKFEPGRVYFKFENLFNGDKLLGESMNTFLNENWKEVSDEMIPSVIEVINKIIKDLLVEITSSFPFKDIFID